MKEMEKRPAISMSGNFLMFKTFCFHHLVAEKTRKGVQPAVSPMGVRI